jgi:hypothetical protein
MCYGSRDQVSSIVLKYVAEEGGVEWLAGREFWEFISGDPNCVDEIYAIAAEVGVPSATLRARHWRRFWRPNWTNWSGSSGPFTAKKRLCGVTFWSGILRAYPQNR